MNSKEKGITLVALVITVIILLILAGVAITAIVGEDGIFSKAKYSAEKYNNAAENEAKTLNSIISNSILSPEPVANGEFVNSKGVNTPDISKLPTQTTKYVTWTGTGTYTEVLSDTVPDNWYDYKVNKWANIKTLSTDGSLAAYWTWIPRFAYKLPESSTPKTIEAAFVKGNGTIVINPTTGIEETGYYATDTNITTGGTGLYKDATALAKGTSGEKAWIIHPAFMFGGKQLSGIWVAKYEASNTSNKVTIKPDITSWRSTASATMFSACLDIKKDGGALGITETFGVDSHLTKSLEWGAIAIISQSKYGRNGTEITINNSSGYFTGRAGGSISASSTTNGTYVYNTDGGALASTTGNIYGIYDIAGGAYESLAGVIKGYESKLGTGIDTKYYDSYTNPGDSNTNYLGGKIGDVTAELLPSSNRTWNGDYAYFPTSGSQLMVRGGYCSNGTYAGPYNYNNGSTGVAETYISFRPVFVVI